MDYNILLEMVSELGYRLAVSGAETFRIEESIQRIMQTYGITSEVFAIPNSLIVSIETPEGIPLTRLRRIHYHGNDLDSVEKYNSLCRKICNERPELDVAVAWLNTTKKSQKQYNFLANLIGNMFAASGFSMLFGGSVKDIACAGVCGISVGLLNRYMENLKANPFFRIIVTSFVMSIIAYFARANHLIDNADMTIIGTLMLLVPGLLFTNAMRDIIYGDTNSGINRIVQVFLIAAAIALGTGTALKLANALWDITAVSVATDWNLPLELLASFIGCAGFALIFNIQGYGSLLCAAGGILAWLVYRILQRFIGDITAYFVASMVAAMYSEIMARIRKYPAISYLVISLLPLIPGSGIYYTMNCVVYGDMEGFADKGFYTIAIAGVMAVGILLTSTVFRFLSTQKNQK